MSTTKLDALLRKLVAAQGSDLHLRVGSPPRLRVHGALEDAEDAAVTDAFTEAVANAIIRPHLADRFRSGEEVDFAYDRDGIGRFRVNAYLQRDSVALVFRTIVAEPKSIDALQLPESVRRFADEPRGLVLIAGPTGSGKTTTLAAMVDHINSTRRTHIVTIEDPIEVMHTDNMASLSQRELGSDTRSFAAAVRAALRQDPDVILVGEMRDPDTVAAALTAAETGHLVLSTLHTTDASETISRVIEFFPPNEQRQIRLVLAGVLKGTVCQRLVPTVDGASRVPATEVLVVNGRVQSWILDPDSRQDVQEIIEEGEYYGMHTFDQSLLSLVERGLIDLETAIVASSNPHDLRVEVRRRGLDQSTRPPDPPPAAPEEEEEPLEAVVERLVPSPPIVPPRPVASPAPSPARRPALWWLRRR